MDVQTLAVSLSIRGGTSLSNFLDYLSHEPIRITDLNEREILVIERLTGANVKHLWAGLLLSKRDTRVIPLLTVKGQKIVITADELAQGTNQIDANFFIINPDTEKALFQTYHGAPPFSKFAHSMGTKFLSFKSIFSVDASFEPHEIIRMDSLEAWLNRVEEIQQFIYEFELVSQRATPFELLKEAASSETVKLIYRKKKLNRDNIKLALKRAAQDYNFKKFLLQGKTDNPLDKYYNLAENKDVVDLADYDTYAKGLVFEGENDEIRGALVGSANIKYLISLYLRAQIRNVLDAKHVP